jgi:TonB family protein
MGQAQAGGVLGGIIISTPLSAPAPQPPPLASAPPLVNKVEPVYPPLAAQARIQGIVRLTATIGADGHITHLSVISGHPLMVPAALEAVKQWVYSPIPNPGTIEIQVPFTLTAQELSSGPNMSDPSTPRKGSFAAATSPRIMIGSGVQASKLISKVEPVYPPQAKAAGIEGTVTLSVIIGEDGHVESVDPKEGHPLLAAAASDAIRQWVYQPTQLNGTPVVVTTTVTVTFP